MSLFPQVAHSQDGSEPAGAPIEHRRLRIIVDGAEPAAESGGVGQAAAAAPTFTSQALEPLPGTAPPPTDVAAQSPFAARPLSSRAPADHAPPPEWVEDALRTPTAPGEGWRIQVGAFRDAARAESAIASLEAIAAGPGADPIRLVAPAGDVWRAQMSGFADRAAADGACARIAATGQACFVVAPE